MTSESNPYRNVPWSPLRVQMLRQLWGDGVGIDAIAEQLNKETTGRRLTRNSISGKADRLKLGAHPNLAGKAWAIRRYGPQTMQRRQQPSPPRRIA